MFIQSNTFYKFIMYVRGVCGTLIKSIILDCIIENVDYPKNGYNANYEYKALYNIRNYWKQCAIINHCEKETQDSYRQ